MRLDRPVGIQVRLDRAGPVSDTNTCSGKPGGHSSPESPSNGWFFFPSFKKKLCDQIFSCFLVYFKILLKLKIGIREGLRC